MTGKRKFLSRVWVLMGIVFVDMLGFLTVLPLLPFYAQDLPLLPPVLEEMVAEVWPAAEEDPLSALEQARQAPASGEPGAPPPTPGQPPETPPAEANKTIIGVLIAAFAFAQLATSPLWGRASDRLGRRPMILLGVALSAVAYVLFGMAGSVLTLLISRLVQGVGAGNIGVVQAYVSDLVPPGERTMAIGWVTVATSAGVMIGPALGSLATDLGRAAPGFIAAGLCLVNLIFAWILLPESSDGGDEATAETGPGAGSGVENPVEPGGAPAESPTSLLRSVLRIVLHPRSRLASLVWIYALGMMAFMALNGVVALYLEEVFDFTERTIGWFYVYVGAVSTVMRGFVLGPVVKRLGEVRTLRTGVCSIAVGLAAIPFADQLWDLALVVLLVPVGTALLFPATTSLVSQVSKRKEVGQSLGVQQAFGGISRMLGPLWATAAYEYLSIRAPFWIAAILMGCVLLVTLRLPLETNGEG